MKKDVTAIAKPEFSLIDENMLKSRIYTIRGLKVMLDADLAEIYGYSTKRFNEQVKCNIERFDEDFRFQLTREEYQSILRSEKPTIDQENLKSEIPTSSWGVSKIVSPRNPFGFFADLFNDTDKYSEIELFDHNIQNGCKVYGVKGKKGGAKRVCGYVKRNSISKNPGWVDSYKLFFSKAYMTTSTASKRSYSASFWRYCSK